MINSIRVIFYSIAVLFIFLIIPGGIIRSQTPFIKHYSTKDGLPSNSCYFTLQDRKGYVWIATDAGVSRFDGKLFETFSIDEGLPDNQIIRLYEDHTGRIWFSALNGQLSYFFNGRIYNQHNNKNLKLLNFNGITISFFEDSKGNIWFGTNRNILVKWDGRSIKKYISASHSGQFINTFVYEDYKHRIWASSAHSLHLFKDDTFKRVQQTIHPISYKTAVNVPGKNLLFLDSKGLNVTNGEQQQFTLKIDNALLTDNPGYFYAENEKDLWLTNSFGVYHLENNGTQTHYLQQVNTSQVIKDNKGNMWFTTNNGIYLLPQPSKRVYVIDQQHGLSSNSIKSITKDHSNRLWLGMDNGMINILSKPSYQITRLDLPDKKKFSNIKQLIIDSSGKIVFFASDYGLGMLNTNDRNAKKIIYLQEKNNFGFVLKNFSLSKENHLAMALSSGVVLLNDPIHKLSFNSAAYREGENFFSSRSYRVFYDQHQNLWFSNTNGLSELTSKKLNTRYQHDSLLTKRINDIAQLPDGTIILATDGYGLLFYQHDRLIRRLTRKDGLANNICKKLFIQQGYIWVINNNAVNRVFLKGKYPVETFEYTNNMLDNDVNGLYVDRDTAYFATNHGLVFFNNKPYDKAEEPPKVLISSIISHKKPLSINSPALSLSPGNNDITFYYSAIDFQNNNISYRYRLKATGSWTETKSRHLEFSSLAPGSYHFELSAKTNNSQWSKAESVSFVLHEHIWQSIWFTLVILLIASASFYKIAVKVTKQQKDKEQQKLLLKNKILMLEQQALQAMMNPHFVFNVMNSIQHYINTKDTSSANKILTGFARLIRKNLDICTKSFISLEEEIEYLTLYLSLEKKRFGEKFNYTISIGENIDRDETMIPSMILQPYIENAIWHGLMPKEEGGHISLIIDSHGDDALLIKIIDDGVGIDNSLRNRKEKHASKGMNLTQERINLLNQIEANPIQINIVQNGNSGTIISIIIPNK